MWKRDSPFYLRPRPAVLPWLARFALASRHSEDGARAIRKLSLDGLELHAQWGEELGTSFERTGTLNVYETEEGLTHEADAADGGGLRYEVLEPSDARARAGADRPRVGPSATRTRAVSTRRGSSRRSAVRQSRRARRSAPASRSGRSTTSRPRPSWSPRAPGRGSSCSSRSRAARATTSTSRPGGRPRIPSWIQETWTIATPLPGRLRLSGTLEFAGLDLSVNAVARGHDPPGGDRAFRGARRRPVLETWAGLRPCLPDGLPVIGRLGRCRASQPVTR